MAPNIRSHAPALDPETAAGAAAPPPALDAPREDASGMRIAATATAVAVALVFVCVLSVLVGLT